MIKSVSVFIACSGPVPYHRDAGLAEVGEGAPSPAGQKLTLGDQVR